MTTDKKTTKEKILEAAGEVFAQKGYAGATVREICDLAGANVASVNYYYGGKEGLYKDLCHHLFAEVFDQFPVTKDFPEGTGPEERLAFFVEGMLNRLLEHVQEGGLPKKSQLLARELAAPTKVMDSLVETFVRPTAGQAMDLIRRILGPNVPEKEAAKCLLSMVGQCVYYSLARPIFSRLELLDLNQPGIVQELAEHITRFSLGGMAAVRREAEGDTVSGAGEGREGMA